jgi:hypothetical protein
MKMAEWGWLSQWVWGCLSKLSIVTTDPNILFLSAGKIIVALWYSTFIFMHGSSGFISRINM